jgi:hypothetical protein
VAGDGDSPHVIEVVRWMPRVYAPPPRKASEVPPDHMVCHVFVGKGTAFEGVAAMRLRPDCPHGTSNTFLIVEAGPPVPWTKPEELLYDPDLPLPDLRGISADGFRARFADGSRHFIRNGTRKATLRAAISRHGGTLRPGCNH